MFTGAELTLIQAQEVSSSIFSFGLIVTCKQSYKVQLKFVSVRGILLYAYKTLMLGKLPTCSLFLSTVRV